MRVKRLKCRPETIIGILSWIAGTRGVSKHLRFYEAAYSPAGAVCFHDKRPLPADVKYHGQVWDERQCVLTVFVESEQFPEVRPGELPSELVLVIEEVHP